MKQITIKQAESLAHGNPVRLAAEIRWEQMRWIETNARYIADIETKRADKTLFGDWPKGWRCEMIRAANENARKSLLERFLRDECKLLDGAIWLGNWEIILALESGQSPTENHFSASSLDFAEL